MGIFRYEFDRFLSTVSALRPGTVFTREKVLAEIRHLNISLNITPKSTDVLNGAVK